MIFIWDESFTKSYKFCKYKKQFLQYLDCKFTTILFIKQTFLIKKDIKRHYFDKLMNSWLKF